MTSLLEVMGNILVIVIVVITKGYGTITMAFFYSVVVPHSLLMNTSHNKNRIIIHGWTNVLKNLFGISKRSIEPEETLGDQKIATNQVIRNMDSIKDLSSKGNGGVKKGVIIKKAIKKKSKNGVARNVQSSSTNTRNEIGIVLMQKTKSKNLA